MLEGLKNNVGERLGLFQVVLEGLTNPNIRNGRGVDLAQCKKNYLIIRIVQNENMPPTKEAVLYSSLEVLKQS